MRVSLVVRGEEWISSVPLHLQLFDALGFARVRYAHIALGHRAARDIPSESGASKDGASEGEAPGDRLALLVPGDVDDFGTCCAACCCSRRPDGRVLIS